MKRQEVVRSRALCAFSTAPLSDDRAAIMFHVFSKDETTYSFTLRPGVSLDDARKLVEKLNQTVAEVRQACFVDDMDEWT